MSERKSPQEYKTKRAIPTKEQLNPFYQPVEDIKPIPIGMLNTKIDIDEDFNTLSVSRDNDIVINNSQNFLCDLELFNWQKIPGFLHNSIINRIKIGISYSSYTVQLCKQIGNDLNLFTDIISKTPTTEIYQQYTQKYTTGRNNMILIDIPVSITIRETIKEGIPLFKLSPIFIVKRNTNVICHYTPQILNTEKRYSIINVSVRLENILSHYNFIFVDHESKTIEYYDPYGINMDKSMAQNIISFIPRIFKGYKINDFWNNSGIQMTEAIEQDEESFCIIWGHMMMHLKLLNIETPIADLEDSLIQYCADKNLSLYEVMLNYSYYMDRVIPKDFKKQIYTLMYS
jgi:hypothetical protein